MTRNHNQLVSLEVFLRCSGRFSLANDRGKWMETRQNNSFRQAFDVPTSSVRLPGNRGTDTGCEIK